MRPDPMLPSPAGPSPGSVSTERRPETALARAWLLLMLADAESYGRALFNGLSERGIAIESNHAYRLLRALDRDGAIASRWTASDSGPQRRVYRLTRSGRSMLTELADRVAMSLRLLESFLCAYEGGDSPAGDDRAIGLSAASRQPDFADDDGVAQGEPATAPAPDHPALTAGRDLLAAWLLLLVQRQAAYGYGLRRALGDHQVRADPGAVYRVLRKLERDGSLESTWTRSDTGPRRRLYRLTDTGRGQLAALAGDVAAARDSQVAFLQTFEQRGDTGSAPAP